MEGISDIKIIGIDEKRPPLLRKEPYIDISFKLSHEAPEDWCEDFNALTKKMDPSVRMDKVKGLYIETYVRHMDEIPTQLEAIKKKIILCNTQYEERLHQKDLAAAAKNTLLKGEKGEQGKLNDVIAGLKYD